MVWIFITPQAVKGGEKVHVNQKISWPSGVSGWKWDGKQTNYNTRTIFDYINGAAELYLAYGFQKLSVRRFEKTGQPPIIVEIYEMGSSEDAYGVFSFERQDENAAIGQGSEFGGGLLRFWKGKFFVSVYAEGEGPEVESAILSVGRAVDKSLRQSGAEPNLVAYLPGREAGLVEKSIRFLRSHVLPNQRFFVSHQNILNLSRQTEAVLAQYLRDKQKTHLLLVRYPDSKESTAAFSSFMKAYMPEAAGKDRLKTEDRKWTFARQQKDFILIVFGAPQESDGEALLKTAEEKILLGHR